jgi:cobalt-zinc-cadmium resistance protein CzcA
MQHLSETNVPEPPRASTVATIGMMPAALATGIGSDVQRGVATVVIGGLILATLLTLLVVPSFYYSLERIAERWAARRQSAVVPTLAQ